MHCQTRGFLFAEIFELPRSLTFIAEYCTVHCKKMLAMFANIFYSVVNNLTEPAIFNTKGCRTSMNV
jgi:hypothetical protein